MKRLQKLICLGIVELCFLQIIAQNSSLNHVSSIFTLDTTLILTHYTEELNSRELVGCVFNNCFYFCQKKAYQNDTLTHNARIFSIDLTSKKQSYFELEFPQVKKSIFTGLHTFWISGLAFSENKLAVFAQDKMILYHKIGNEQYKYDQTILLYNVYYGYFHGNFLYVFQNDNRQGYALLRYDTLKYKKEKVKIFPFEAAFLLQFTPNRYISIEDSCFYILETNRPQYKKYDLTGELIDSVNFTSFFDWRPIPSTLIEEVMRLNYGVDRIYYALQYNKQNSYPCKIFPFDNDNALIMSHQYNNAKEREAYTLTYLQHSKEKKERDAQYFRYLTYDEDQYTNHFFPLYFFSPELCFTYPYKKTLIQISKESDCDYYGKTEKEYRIEKENYFKDHPPIITARFMSLKETFSFVAFDSLFFNNYDNEQFQLHRKHPKKWILLFQPPIYCHGCMNFVLTYLNGISVDTSLINFGIMIESQLNSYLVKRERLQDISRYFHHSYTPCYIEESERISFFNALGKINETPIVMLIDYEKRECVLLGESDIFTKNRTKFELKKDFHVTIHSFIMD